MKGIKLFILVLALVINQPAQAGLSSGVLSYCARALGLKSVDDKISIAEILKFNDKLLLQRLDLTSDPVLKKPLELLTDKEMQSVVTSIQTISKNETQAGGLSIGLAPVVDSVQLYEAQEVAREGSKYILGDERDPRAQAVFINGSRVFLGPQVPYENGAQQWEVIHPTIRQILIEWVNKKWEERMPYGFLKDHPEMNEALPVLAGKSVFWRNGAKVMSFYFNFSFKSVSGALVVDIGGSSTKITLYSAHFASPQEFTMYAGQLRELEQGLAHAIDVARADGIHIPSSFSNLSDPKVNVKAFYSTMSIGSGRETVSFLKAFRAVINSSNSGL